MRYELKQASSSTAGFTIAELLVVVMIAGILAAIAAPSYLGFIASRRATMAQSEILQVLRQAQTDAIRTRQPQTVTFNAAITPPTVQINSRTATRLGTESLQRQLSASALGLQVNGSSDTPNNVVEFDSRGAVTRGVNMIITATAPAGSTRRRCVIVQTVLGTLRTAQNQECATTP